MPVRLHPSNQRYLLYRGKPFLVVTSAEHYGAVLNPDFDFRRYLAALERDGMNYTRIFTGSYVEIPGSFGIARNTLAPDGGRFLPPWTRSDTPGYAGGGNKFDLDRWNPDYFGRLREFIDEAGRRGILVEVTFFSSHYREEHWKHSPFHPNNNVNSTTALADYKLINTLDNGNILARQEAMVRRIVRELNEFDNVIYEMQNEPWADRSVMADVINPYLPEPQRDRWPNSVDLADAASLGWQKRVAAWIADEQATLPNKHLIAQNYCNFRHPVPLEELLPVVSIINFHYAWPEAVWWNAGLNKVINYDESGFIGSSDDAYREQAWRFLLAGGGAFNNLDYSFTAGHEDGTDTEPNGPGGGSPALRRQLRILREFLEALPFTEMDPDFRTIRRAPGVVPTVLSAPGKAYALYLAGEGRASLLADLPEGSYRAEWIDPKNGQALKSGSFDHPGGIGTLRSPDYRTDVALRLVAT